MNATSKLLRRSRRGAALILVLMLVAVFLILMGSLIDALAIENPGSIESADSSAAATAAYSGVDLMVLSIEEFYDNGIQNGQPPQTVNCAFNRPGGGDVPTSCTASIRKSWNGAGLNYYLIYSTGSANPNTDKEVDRQIVALVRQIPFGDYAHFSASGNSNTGDEVWYSQNQSYDGPVYSGGKIRIMYNTDGNPSPIFPMGFTSDAPRGNIKWYDVADGNGSAPNTPQEVAAVFGSSQPTFEGNPIELPGFGQNLDIFSEAYYGDSNHGDSTDLQDAGEQKGVFVNGGDPSCPSGTLCTGVFVSGDNVTVQASSVASPSGDLSSGSQTWKISSPDFPSPVTVTVNFANNTTTVVGAGGQTTTYSGVASGEQSDSSQGNGALFVDGSVVVADGSTVHGQYTLAVPDPPVNDESIDLQGDLTYSSDPRSGPSQDELALWADTIGLTTGENNPTIMAEIMTGYSNECAQKGCGGYFDNTYCTAKGCVGGGTGTLTVYGSDIENMRGKMGVVNGAGTPVQGFLRAQSYDARLGADPPPFAPTTNLYSIVALQDVGSP